MSRRGNGQRPRIIVLDGYTNNPGDLSWDAFELLGDFICYDSTDPHQLIERCTGQDILLTNKTMLGEQAFAQLPETRYIGVLATGTNVVNIAAARRHQIAVTNVPDYGTASVAQHAVGLLLSCACRISELDRTVQSGEWQRRGVFSYWNRPPIELAGKTLGLIGLGAIGHRVALIAQSLDMNVIAYTPSGRQATGVTSVTLPQLQAEADAISLHCPLTDANEGLINTDFLALTKPGMILVNTARGGLVDESAVADALHSGHLGGVGIDVLSSEPPALDNPLLGAPRCIVTPHSAWASTESRSRLLHIAAANLAAFLTGRRANRID